MLRLEVRNSQTPIERKPPWIKTRLRTGPSVHRTAERWSGAKGCTRSARRPAAPTSSSAGRTARRRSSSAATSAPGAATSARSTPASRAARPDEPRRVAESVAAMGLRYATITGVARDDLADGGAWLYAQTSREIHAAMPGSGVELLIPDFNADPELLAEVFDARPEVLAHNLETVPRIFRRIGPGSGTSARSTCCSAAREAGLVTKSNLILGLGEERHEITAAMPTCAPPAATC